MTTEDLRTFGMIPEFLGRLPIVVTLQALTKELMVKVLREPKNADFEAVCEAFGTG